MGNTKVILYDCLDIYKILNEIKNVLKFDIEYIDKEVDLISRLKDYDTYLIISKYHNNEFKNQIVLKDFPMKISNLIEKINLAILKANFSVKSNIVIKKYLLDLNSREISYKKKKTKLTEQEVKILIYLEKLNDNVKVDKLQKDIWGYGKDLETHTVETHIHRLRKKFLKVFNDDNFIISSKEGYYINWKKKIKLLKTCLLENINQEY